jgi:hypothetical protein
VRPYAASGTPGPRSGSVSLEVPAPDYLPDAAQRSG